MKRADIDKSIVACVRGQFNSARRGARQADTAETVLKAHKTSRACSKLAVLLSAGHRVLRIYCALLAQLLAVQKSQSPSSVSRPLWCTKSPSVKRKQVTTYCSVLCSFRRVLCYRQTRCSTVSIACRTGRFARSTRTQVRSPTLHVLHQITVCL